MNNESKQIFLNYFEEGMTPSSAKNYHEMKLLTEANDDKILMETLADSQINPKDTEINYLYKEWR